MVDPSRQKRRRLWRTILLWGAGLLLLMLALMTALSFALRTYFSKRCDEILAAASQAGLPTTTQDLEALYETPPASEDAAPAYLDALAKINVFFPSAADAEGLPYFGESVMPRPSEPVPTTLGHAAGALLERNREALQALRRAASFSRCRYPIDFTLGFNIKLDHLKPLKDSAHLLALDALIRAAEGDAATAVEDTLAVTALARSLSNEPVIISQLTRAAIEQVAAETLEQLLNRVVVAAPGLDRLQTAFQSAEATGAWDVMTDGEFLFGLRLPAQTGFQTEFRP